MRCPVCGGSMEKQFGFSGDLYQTNDFRYICQQCGYKGASDADVLAQVVKKLQEKKDNG